jgi:hypothetical protein
MLQHKKRNCNNNTNKTAATNESNNINSTPNKATQKELVDNLSPTVFGTNKNGLPIEVQKEILFNVARFEGYDDFVRGTCDGNPSLFGEKGSKRRKACYSKRQRLIDLRNYNPVKFSDLCVSFGLIHHTTEQVKQTSIPTSSTKDNKTINNKLAAKQEEEPINNYNNIYKINKISDKSLI